MSSKSAPKRGFQKNTEQIMIFSTPTPLWIELWLQRELDFHFLIRCVFGTLLGLILEVFWEAKWRPRASKRGSQKSFKNMSKTLSIFDRFWGPFGVPNGARKVQIRAPKSDLASSMVLRGSRGRFGTYFWSFLGPSLSCFLCAFLTYRSTCAYVFETLTLAFRLVPSVLLDMFL